MSCVSCPNEIMAVSVATAQDAAAESATASQADAKSSSGAVVAEISPDYTTTITVPESVSFNALGTYCIAIRCPVVDAQNVSCAKVVVTNGTDTVPILICDGDNWRPCAIKCRTILKLRYHSDPAHFVVEQVKR